MTSVITSYTSWHWSFWVQAIGLSPCVIAIALMPKKYLDVETASKNKTFAVLSVDRKLKRILRSQNVSSIANSRKVDDDEIKDDNPYT